MKPDSAVKPTMKNLTIFSTLATGWFPWGVKMHGAQAMPRRERDGAHYWPLACGLCYTDEEAEQLCAEGLMVEIPVKGIRTISLTEAGKTWLNVNWPDAEDAERWL